MPLRDLRNVLFVRNVFNALIVMGAFLALIWILQVFNWADSYHLDQSFGIMPRDPGRLGDVFTAPFLHANFAHIEANSVPLFVIGVAAAYRGVLRFLAVSVIVAIVSGLTVWFFQGGNSVTIGASGLIFGYFGYVLVRGLIDRNLLDLGIGALVGFGYWWILQVALPSAPHGISWLGHLGGLIGGVLAAWLLRSRSAQAVPAGRSFGGWTLGVGSAAGAGNRAARTPERPGSAPERPASTGRPGAAPAAGPASGSQAAEDLLRQIKDLGF
jgi:membrane associated rhomboid family serine protease